MPIMWSEANFHEFSNRKIGFYGIFSLSAALYLVAFFYGIFLLDEVPPKPKTEMEKPKDEPKKSFCADFFDITAVTETFKVAFKNGDKRRRTKIIMLMIVVMVVVGPWHGKNYSYPPQDRAD